MRRHEAQQRHVTRGCQQITERRWSGLSLPEETFCGKTALLVLRFSWRQPGYEYLQPFKECFQIGQNGIDAFQLSLLCLGLCAFVCLCFVSLLAPSRSPSLALSPRRVDPPSLITEHFAYVREAFSETALSSRAALSALSCRLRPILTWTQNMGNNAQCNSPQQQIEQCSFAEYLIYFGEEQL